MKKIILGLAVVLALAASAKAVVFSRTYNFNTGNGDLSSSTGNNYATFSSIVVDPPAVTFTGTELQTVKNAWSGTTYLSYTITPGTDLAAITRLSFDASVIGGNVTARMELRRGSDSAIVSGNFTITSATPGNQVFNLSSPLTVSSPVEVRIYATVPNGNGNNLNFDNIYAEGEAVLVPEPINVALALFGCTFAGIGFGRKFLKKKV